MLLNARLRLAHSGEATRAATRHHVLMTEKMTNEEFFSLFGRTVEGTRWAGSADAVEYLTLVSYLVERASWMQPSA